MKKLKLGERSGYIIIISVFLLVVNLTLGAFLINLSGNALINQIESRMLDIVNTAADMLDGDKLKNLKKEDFYTKDYQDAIKTLDHFQKNIQLEYIYCIQATGEKEFVFSVDPTKDDPGEFGSPIVFTNALYQASLGKPSVDKTPYEDEWGRFYSAYSPVFDSEGKVALIVAVDFSADWYNAQVFVLVRTVLIVCALSLLAGGLIVFLIMERTRRRNRRLYAELSTLADNVESLVSEVNHATHSENNPIFSSDSDERGDDIRALSRKIRTMQDNLRAEIEHVHKMAYIDALTAVGNTAAYMGAVSAMNQQIDSGEAEFGVAAFDLNGLKEINDTYGHACGDAAICGAADVLCRVFGRENVYRTGGDEFIAIIPASSSKEMEQMFSQIDEELNLENQKKKPYPVTISVSKGYSVFQKESDGDYKTVSRRADAAMYRDKDAYYERKGQRR